MITDQAERLRKLVKRKEMGLDLGLATFMEDKLSVKRRMIVFVGDEDEVLSNSNSIANIAVIMAKSNHKVMVVDACRGKIDASIPLGIHPHVDMSEVVQDPAKAKDVVYKGAGNVKFVKMGEMMLKLDSLDFQSRINFFNQWSCLEEEADIFLVHETKPMLALTTSEVMVMTSPTHRAVTSAYAKVKLLLNESQGLRLGVIVNMCLTQKEAAAVSRQLITTTKRFLNTEIEDVGFVMLATEVIRALKAKAPFVLKFPYSVATSNIQAIASKIISTPEYNRYKAEFKREPI